MSYILEALKKSQRERELGEVPTLESEPYTPPAAPPGSSNRWLIATTLLAFLALITVVYGVFYQKAEHRPPPEQTVADRVVAEPEAPPGAQIKDEPIVTGTTRDEFTVQEAESEKVVATPEVPPEIQTKEVPTVTSMTQVKPAETEHSPSSQTAPLIQTEPIAEEPAPETAVATEQEADTTAADTEPESQREQELQEMKSRYRKLVDQEQSQRALDATTPGARTEVRTEKASTPPPDITSSTDYPLAHELPPSIVQQLPDLRVSLYYYDDNPADRFVIINSKKHIQGDQIPGGVVLREIRKDGLVLGYSNRVFFQPR